MGDSVSLIILFCSHKHFQVLLDKGTMTELSYSNILYIVQMLAVPYMQKRNLIKFKQPAWECNCF